MPVLHHSQRELTPREKRRRRMPLPEKNKRALRFVHDPMKGRRV